MMGAEVTGATMGIVGMGDIGYKIAQRGRGFEMKILYHNRRRRKVSGLASHLCLLLFWGMFYLDVFLMYIINGLVYEDHPVSKAEVSTLSHKAAASTRLTT